MICLGASSLAFGNKGETHEEAMLYEMRRIGDLLELLNTQISHQTQILHNTELIMEVILDFSKPINYDEFKEQARKPS